MALGLATAVVVAGFAVIAFGAAEGLFIPTLQDIAMEVSTDADRGSVMALWVAAARFGQTIGPLVAGLALTTLSTGSTLVAGSLLGVAVLLFALFGGLSGSDHHSEEALAG